MPVPELDWPADLFGDAMPKSASRVLVSTSPETQSDADGPLWPAMQDSRLTSHVGLFATIQTWPRQLGTALIEPLRPGQR